MMVYDFKPETEEEIKARKAKDEANRMFKSISFKEVSARIAELVLRQMMLNIAINKDTPKMIGGTMFWLDFSGDAPVLMYNRHPSKWDKDAVIYELEIEEHNMLYSGRLHQ